MGGLRGTPASKERYVLCSGGGKNKVNRSCLSLSSSNSFNFLATENCPWQKWQLPFNSVREWFLCVPNQICVPVPYITIGCITTGCITTLGMLFLINMWLQAEVVSPSLLENILCMCLFPLYPVYSLERHLCLQMYNLKGKKNQNFSIKLLNIFQVLIKSLGSTQKEQQRQGPCKSVHPSVCLLGFLRWQSLHSWSRKWNVGPDTF